MGIPIHIVRYIDIYYHAVLSAEAAAELGWRRLPRMADSGHRQAAANVYEQSF